MLRIPWASLAWLLLIGFQLIAVAQTNRDANVDQIGDVLPTGAKLRMGSVRFCSPEGVMEFFLTEDKSTLVSFGRLIIGWDVRTGKELWRSRNPNGYLPASYGMRPITGSPDGQHFLLAGPDGAVTRWNALDGTNEPTALSIQAADAFARAGRGCRAIDCTRDGEFTFIGLAQGYSVYDESGERLYGVDQNPKPANFGGRDRLKFGGPYSYGRFSPNGKLLAVTMSSHPTEVKILEAANGELLGTLACRDNVVRFAFTPDSKRLAATERDTAVRLYDVENFERLWEHEFNVDKRSENYSSALAFSPSGRTLAVCERNQQIFVMDVASGEEVGVIRDHSWNPWAVVFASDDDTLFSSGWGGTIHRWSVSRLQPLPLPEGISGTSVAATSSDGDRCAYVDQSGTIRLVSTVDGTEITTLQVPNGSFEIVEFSRDGSHLAAGGPWEGQVHVIIWRLEDGQVVNQWSWDIGDDPVTGVEEIRFSRDDSRVGVAVFRQDAAYLLDLSSGERKRLPHSRVYGLSFTSDDEALITAGWDKRLKRWDSSSGELVMEQQMPDIGENDDTRMYTVCCDPLGAQLATAQMRSQIRLWNVSDFSPIRHWDTGSSFVFGSLRYSPDGLWLASGDASGRLTLWDPSTGEELHQIQAHEDHVYLVGFGRDNRTICTGGANIGYFWDLRPSKLGPTSAREAYEQLCGGSGRTKYEAWWYLVELGDPAITEIVDNTSKITRVFDIDSQTRDLDGDQRASRERVLRKVAASNQNAVTLAAVRRIVSVLSHVGTPKAIAALEALSVRDDALGRHSAWELRRRAR